MIDWIASRPFRCDLNAMPRSACGVSVLDSSSSSNSSSSPASLQSSIVVDTFKRTFCIPDAKTLYDVYLSPVYGDKDSGRKGGRCQALGYLLSPHDPMSDDVQRWSWEGTTWHRYADGAVAALFWDFFFFTRGRFAKLHCMREHAPQR